MDPVGDALRMSWGCTKAFATNENFGVKVGTIAAPFFGFVGGAGFSAQYSSHKQEVADRLGEQARKMKSI